MAKKLKPVHPGEILLKDFLEPMNLSQYRVAKALNVPPRRINEIVLGKRSITADTALRLARYFGTSDRFWLNLQDAYDLDVERDRLGPRLQKEVQVLRRAGCSARERKAISSAVSQVFRQQTIFPLPIFHLYSRRVVRNLKYCQPPHGKNYSCLLRQERRSRPDPDGPHSTPPDSTQHLQGLSRKSAILSTSRRR
jgi:antitoxin HigA-1